MNHHVLEKPKFFLEGRGKGERLELVDRWVLNWLSTSLSIKL